MQKIVGVKRINDRDLYYFLQNIDDLKVGDKLVVEFDEFETIAEVKTPNIDADDEKAYELKKIKRRAIESDISKFESLFIKAKSKLPEIKKKSLELGLMMKFISAEYSLDESKVLITFSSEERVDFRALLKELASMLKTRIELKQIGQRDEVKICGGVGPCGEQCCCARFLKNFDHVTVKMAKVQGLSLSPTKINGICGRLMCCLGYESEMYEKMLEKMPKLGSIIKAPNGEGTVVYNDILRERVSVKRKVDGDSFVVEDFSLEELEEFKKNGYVKKEPPKQEEKIEQQVENGEVKSAETKDFKQKGDFKHNQNNRPQINGRPDKKESFGMEIVDASQGENLAGKENRQNASNGGGFRRKKHHKFAPKKDMNKK